MFRWFRKQNLLAGRVRQLQRRIGKLETRLDEALRVISTLQTTVTDTRTRQDALASRQTLADIQPKRVLSEREQWELDDIRGELASYTDEVARMEAAWRESDSDLDKSNFEAARLALDLRKSFYAEDLRRLTGG